VSTRTIGTNTCIWQNFGTTHLTTPPLTPRPSKHYMVNPHPRPSTCYIHRALAPPFRTSFTNIRLSLTTSKITSDALVNVCPIKLTVTARTEVSRSMTGSGFASNLTVNTRSIVDLAPNSHPANQVLTKSSAA